MIRSTFDGFDCLRSNHSLHHCIDFEERLKGKHPNFDLRLRMDVFETK